MISIRKAINSLDKDLGWPLCNHGERVQLFLSETELNPDRLLYRCRKTDLEGCQYFIWVDDFEKAVDNQLHNDNYTLRIRRRHILDACKRRNDENKLSRWSARLVDDVLAEFDKHDDEITNFSDDDDFVESSRQPNKRLYDVDNDKQEDLPSTPKRARRLSPPRQPRHRKVSDFFKKIDQKGAERERSHTNAQLDTNELINYVKSTERSHAALAQELEEAKEEIKKLKKESRVYNDIMGKLYKLIP